MAERPTHFEEQPISSTDTSLEEAYSERKDSLNGLPQTTLAPEYLTHDKMPNIFTSRDGLPSIWVDKEEGVPLHMVTGKADVGGVGGHVEVADEVKGEVEKFLLEHNRDRNNRRIFRSGVAMHAGDDVSFTATVEAQIMEERPEMVEELYWEALMRGADVAKKLGLYGPGQDLKADAYTGNIHGMGPAFLSLPLPVRSKETLRENPSQSVMAAFGDKTEPAVMNWITNFGLRYAMDNTGMTIAESRMKNGYIFELVDVNTKVQALESGIPANNPEAIDAKMEELSQGESVVVLNDADRLESKLIDFAQTGTTRYTIDKVWSQDENGEAHELGVIVSAERLHNIKTAKGFAYGGKDDPALLALCQGDWPAPGELTSKLRITPLVNGDCRGSHRGPLYPAPVNSQTAFYSGPIIEVVVMSVNLETGLIGDMSDQLARGTMWDKFRQDASDRFDWIRDHGYMDPAVLSPDELEYHARARELKAELDSRFTIRPKRESQAA